MTDVAVKAGQNQSLFREVNERLRDVNETFDATAHVTEFVCECANPECFERVTLTLADYERIRAEATHFFVVAEREHVFPDVERIIDERDGFFVVEKVGEAGTEATKHDPRSRDAAGS